MPNFKVSFRGAIHSGTSLSAMCIALAFAASAQAADTSGAESYAAQLDSEGAYLTGDKHNHTTCTDGTTSVRTLVDQSTLVYGLDWFAQTGHGGSGSRDCRFDDVQSGNFFSDFELERGNSRELWEDTIGLDGLKGDENGNRMWRWQSLTEYAYPDVQNAGQISDATTWLGIESNVPGHEHVSMAILGKQFRRAGDAYATGQFEYLWDRNDNDFSGGDENEFEAISNNGVSKTPNTAGDHAKSVASVEWLRTYHRRDSYYLPAHIDRQGAYVSTASRGFNVEHMRDYHNAGLFTATRIDGPSVAFGAELAPGHQFQTNRGSYSLGRPTAGFGTYGGAGAYGAAEIAPPGTDFDGTPITDEKIDAFNVFFDEEFGGNPFTSSLGNISDSRPVERYVVGRPGIQTLWDALLGEGRRYFNFASSDWHNRGAFGPFEPFSTNDAWPGEYQKIYAYAEGGDGGYNLGTARAIVDGMRSGNSFSVWGDLITDLDFVMCQGAVCATMGETLFVDPWGEPIVWYVALVDPEGANNSPYTFDNPSLLQLDMNIPINEPVLDNVDIIRGDITGPIFPDQPEYTTNVSNPTTEIYATIQRDGFEEVDGKLVASGEIAAGDFTNDMYFRMRGTNMPKGTPNETDADGNPLIDYYANNIPCPFPYVDPDPETAVQEFDSNACPFYLPVNERVGSQVIDFDVESWSDLWFYANPIFVEVNPRQAQRAAERANR